MRDNNPSYANTCRISPVLLHLAHIARTLADDFIIALISLEFYHDVITADPVLGEHVDVTQRSTLDLTAQILKLSSPR